MFSITERRTSEPGPKAWKLPTHDPCDMLKEELQAREAKLRDVLSLNSELRERVRALEHDKQQLQGSVDDVTMQLQSKIEELNSERGDRSICQRARSQSRDLNAEFEAAKTLEQELLKKVDAQHQKNLELRERLQALEYQYIQGEGELSAVEDLLGAGCADAQRDSSMADQQSKFAVAQKMDNDLLRATVKQLQEDLEFERQHRQSSIANAALSSTIMFPADGGSAHADSGASPSGAHRPGSQSSISESSLDGSRSSSRNSSCSPGPGRPSPRSGNDSIANLKLNGFATPSVTFAIPPDTNSPLQRRLSTPTLPGEYSFVEMPDQLAHNYVGFEDFDDAYPPRVPFLSPRTSSASTSHSNTKSGRFKLDFSQISAQCDKNAVTLGSRHGDVNVPSFLAWISWGKMADAGCCRVKSLEYGGGYSDMRTPRAAREEARALLRGAPHCGSCVF